MVVKMGRGNSSVGGGTYDAEEVGFQEGSGKKKGPDDKRRRPKR
jgi:hypothetical protein